ncbi:MAG: DNA helicase RecQ [bacterium]
MQSPLAIAAQDTEDHYDTLKRVFGFAGFREGQQPVIEAVLAGENVLAVMPTGAGKSLCFQLPAVMADGLTIIVSPLIALMENQVTFLRSIGVVAGMIHSGRHRAENVADWQKAQSGKLKILYMSPERLVSARMKQALTKLNLIRFVIDEAHCISQWGHDFRKDYNLLSTLKQDFPSIPISAFTATATDETRKDIIEQLFHGDIKSFVQGFDRPNIAISVEEKHKSNNRLMELVQQRQNDQGIIYCLSRKGAEKTAEILRQQGHNALCYHAGLADDIRAQRLNRFLTEKNLIMCATIAFGMGIDKPDIRYVIHMNMPASPEHYYQEIGRAGRDGRSAEAILFYGLNDLRLRRSMIDDSGASDDMKRIERRRLDALTLYAETTQCRRNMLLAYFGEERTDDCGHCDNCCNPPQLQDGTAQAQLVLGLIQATGEIYGQGHLISILRGGRTEKIRTAGHDQLSQYAAGKALGDRQWRRIIRQMISSEMIAGVGQFSSLQILPKGEKCLQGIQKISFRCDLLTSSLRQSSVRRGPKSTHETELFIRLKEERLRLATQEDVPAFVIFSDRTLIDMANKRPSSYAEFLGLFGVGERKASQYAEAFLAILMAQDTISP